MAMIDLYGLVLTIPSGIDDINGSQNSLELYNAQAQLVAGVVSVSPVGAIATSPTAGVLNIIKISVDLSQTGSVNAGDVLSLVGNGVALAGGIVALGFAAPGLGLALTVTGLALTVAAHYPTIHNWNFNFLPAWFEGLGDWIPISSAVAAEYTTATLLPAPRRDPLVLDLDGDGIKSAVLNNRPLDVTISAANDEQWRKVA